MRAGGVSSFFGRLVFTDSRQADTLQIHRSFIELGFIMFAFLAVAILSQFQAADAKAVTLDDYLQLSREQKLNAVAGAKMSVETEWNAVAKNQGRKLSSSQQKKRKAELAEIEAYEKDEAQIHEVPLLTNAFEVGKVGIVTAGSFVRNGKIEPLNAKVLQVLGKTQMLCSVNQMTVLIRGIDTTNLADDTVFDLSQIMLVCGKYSYKTVVGAKKTVFAIEPWKLNSEWQEQKEKLIAATNKSKVGTAPNKSSKKPVSNGKKTTNNSE